MSNKRKQRAKEKTNVVFPVAEQLSSMPETYINFIDNLKDTIEEVRLKSVLSANNSMILMYWNIGKAILEKQKIEGWGAKVIDRMSHDLKTAFPDISGFSPRNLKYMRKFADAWEDIEIVQRTVAQIPWRSNITLLDKLKDDKLRLWYAIKTIENGFGKDMLVFQIESKLHLREGNAISNFDMILPPLNSDLATQSFKDPYIFDFVGNVKHIRKKELKYNLLEHVQNYLLELGQGFAFVGKEVHLELGGDDFYLDLLFYNIQLKSYVVIEVKTGKFEPGDGSELNMHLNVVNDTMCQKEDNKTIGLLLVKSKNKTLVEYSLDGFKNPISVSNWENEIVKSIPDNMKYSLPTVEEIEAELKEIEEV